MQAIPEIVAKRVQHAMAELRWCAEELERLFALDSRFGGDGRYESEGWIALQGRIASAERTMAEFRRIAETKGIDVEQVLLAWGGVKTPCRSARCLSYQ